MRHWHRRGEDCILRAMHKHGSRLLLPFSMLALLTASAGLAGAPVFTDITAGAGIGLDGKLTESVTWGDYDGDGDEDLYLTSDGANNLFRNDGGGTFTDVTAEAGVGHEGFSVGTAFGDLDNDGDLDLYVVSFGVGPDVLYRNDGPVGPGGAYVFTDITQTAGTTDESSSRGVALIDFDRDGMLDIYVNAIGPDILYHNLGGLTFANVAGTLGVATVGQGVGAVATDLDANGWLDLFTGNRSADPNRLYMNSAGTFADATVTAGITEVGLGMGVLSFDFDNDLDFDLYWTSWPGTDPGGPRPNALYRNEGNGTYSEVAAASGTLDPLGWGISCNAGDVDNDGWMDFFVTNGFSDDSTANVLFLNQGNGTFTDATAALGGGDFDGRGVAFADFDGDGDLDLVVTADAGSPTRLWRNDSAGTNRWLVVKLEGRVSNRSAVGARIEVETDQGTFVGEVSGGAGRGSQNSLPVEFGLGSASQIQDLRVRWPSGVEESFGPVDLDQTLFLRETSIFFDTVESGDLSRWANSSLPGIERQAVPDP